MAVVVITLVVPRVEVITVVEWDVRFLMAACWAAAFFSACAANLGAVTRVVIVLEGPLGLIMVVGYLLGPKDCTLAAVVKVSFCAEVVTTVVWVVFTVLPGTFFVC